MNVSYEKIVASSSVMKNGQFSPDHVSSFHIQDWSLREMPEINGLSLSLIYCLNDDLPLAEEFLFPDVQIPEDEEKRHILNRLGHCIHVAAGISYYKCACPKTLFIHTVSLPQQILDFFKEFYTLGLGEFCVENNRELLKDINWQIDSEEEFLPAINKLFPGNTPRVFLPIGGGKDSFVSLDLLSSIGVPTTPVYIGGSAIIGKLCTELSIESLPIGRRLSPVLSILNKHGAYNGHIPITGIHSFVLLFAAVLYDMRAVVFSNEQSANSGNLLYQGIEVNHQYSKSLGFEQHLQSILPLLGLHEESYFSLLRPYTELAVCRKFAMLSHYHEHFVSCNKNFSLSSNTSQKLWCARCPKCLFVFLALAPFLSKQSLLKIFGSDLFEDSQNESLLDALLGLDSHRPFECVGDRAECRAALGLLGEHPDWKKHPLIKRKLSALDSVPDASIFFEAARDHGIPQQLIGAVHAYFNT